jgi:predicted DCC family thiol-disulfide oxidoreductase YuxK
MNQHLVFFDAECPLCYRAVQHLISIDKDLKFRFAPIDGKTSSSMLTGPLKRYLHVNSLVLIENYQSTERHFYIRSKATLRIYWLIGHKWTALGFLNFFPTFIGDAIYRKLAKHQHKFKIKMPHFTESSSRFLP